MWGQSRYLSSKNQGFNSFISLATFRLFAIYLTYISIKVHTASCTNTKTDLVFFVDSSGSVGTQNFEYQRQMLRLIVEDLEISSADTRIAVAVYSTTAELEVPWQQNKTEALNHR